MRRVATELASERFPVQATTSDRIAFARTLVDQIAAYDEIVDPLARAATAPGAYGDRSHSNLVEGLVSTVARTAHRDGPGDPVLLDVRTYPTLPLVYAGALSAVSQRNGIMLEAFVETPQTKTVHGPEPVFTSVHPWAPFRKAENEASLLVFTQRRGKPVEDATVTEFLSGHRQDSFYTPMSIYLLRRMRPVLTHLVPDDGEYYDLFEQTEALLGFIAADHDLQRHAGGFSAADLMSNPDAHAAGHAVFNRIARNGGRSWRARDGAADPAKLAQARNREKAAGLVAARQRTFRRLRTPGGGRSRALPRCLGQLPERWRSGAMTEFWLRRRAHPEPSLASRATT